MRALVDELCSEECAGRAPGSPEGARARAAVVRALRAAGLDPFEQPVPGCRGANVIATLPGEIDRWVIVGAHFDHLGRYKKDVYWGADDNAAAVSILAEVAAGAARRRPAGRGVIFAAFDGEEPPYFLTAAMGSRHFAANAPVPLDRVDMMVCMDLVGHALGPPGVPAAVRSSLFALGAERSAGTAAGVDRIAAAEPGLVVRRVDAETVPTLSDYEPFWRRRVPFLFLTAGRSRHYHSPSDTPETLDYAKMASTARWLERFVRETCARPEGRVGFLEGARDDASTLRSVAALSEALMAVSDVAELGRAEALRLLDLCDPEGRLPEPCRPEASALIAELESALA
jgi:hypothetical protein